MLESDSNIEVKICSVIRGMIPASSGESMSAPFVSGEWRVMCGVTIQLPYHHGEGLARSGLSISEYSPVIAIEHIYTRNIIRTVY